MDEIIERVARVLLQRAYGLGVDFDQHGTDIPEAVATKLARAAIEAMREPSPEMIGASAPFKSVKGKWQAMIEEALKDD